MTKPVMLAALALLVILLSAPPAWAPPSGDYDTQGSNGGRDDPYDGGSSSSGDFLQRDHRSRGRLPELGSGRNRTCPNCRTDRLQDDRSQRTNEGQNVGANHGRNAEHGDGQK